MYCNASSTALTAVVRCFQLKEKVLGLYATLYQSSDRWHFCEEFAPQAVGGGGYNRISVHVCERTDVYIAEQNIIIKKNNTQPFKEGNKKMYTRVISFGDFFILHSDIIR